MNAPQPTYEFRAWAVSDKGPIRRNNEDRIMVSSQPSVEPLTDWYGGISSSGGWVLVADGMGGHAGGEIASELAVELLSPLMPHLRNHADVTCALAMVNFGLFEAMDRMPDLDGMGTTIAGVVFQGRRVLAFKLGDSRIYWLRNAGLSRLSEDHVIDGHVLTQCLGGYGAEPLRPHVKDVELSAGDTLLLCTDGLTDLVSYDLIEKRLAEPIHAASRLAVEALRLGGLDNVSVAVVVCSP